MLILIMGPAGSGKSTVGKMLAEAMQVPFIEGDDFHPAANIQKMSAGIALTDDDRRPWLCAVQERIREVLNNHASCVVACSALKQSYRDFLLENFRDVQTILLKAPEHILAKRLAIRAGHFMPASLVKSQLEALEEPANAMVFNSEIPPDTILKAIKDALQVNESKGDH